MLIVSGFTRASKKNKQANEWRAPFMNSNPRILMIKSGRKTKQISPEEIEYIICDCSICDLHFIDLTSFTCTKSLCYFQEVLPSELFYRINHNIIINHKRVSEIVSTKGRGHEVCMKSGAVLTVSYRKWTDFKNQVFGKWCSYHGNCRTYWRNRCTYQIDCSIWWWYRVCCYFCYWKTCILLWVRHNK